MGAPLGETGTTTPTGGQESTIPTPPSTGQSNTPSAPTFTQADLDRVVADRLSREKAKYADYDALKQRAEAWDKFEAESQTQQQKDLALAVKEAEQAAYGKAREEYGSRLVEAHLSAAAAGRLTEAALAALLAGVNKQVFLTEAGEIDAAKVTSFIDGIAPTTPTRPGGFGQGPRSGQPRPGLDSGAALYDARHAKGSAPPLFS